MGFHVVRDFVAYGTEWLGFSVGWYVKAAGVSWKIKVICFFREDCCLTTSETKVSVILVINFIQATADLDKLFSHYFIDAFVAFSIC